MIVYSNSCSFGAPQGHTIYPEVVATELSARLVNEGTPASCNRRIIRSSVRSLLELQKNYSGPLLALIGLSFISRTELWQPHLPPVDRDGDFHPITNASIQRLDWSKGILSTHRPNIHEYADAEVKDYYKQWLLHFSKEAEVTNLLADVVMLESFARFNNVKILIFCNCQKLPSLPDVDTTAPFLASFKEYADTKNSIIDLWNFSFADFALDSGHLPKDQDRYGTNGHPGKEAHYEFGKYLLEKFAVNQH